MFTVGTMNAMAQYLEDRGYVKLNPRLYMKNIESDIVTGSFILVDLRRQRMSFLKINEKFLFFPYSPKIKIQERQYYNIHEFKSYLINNENIEVEFLKRKIRK